MGSERPKIPLSKDRADHWLDAISLFVLVATWIYAVIKYASLPGQIPVHYNVKGMADSYGSKASIFILLSVFTIVWVGMTVLNRYPHLFNYPVKITSANAEQQYRSATRLIRVIKLLIVSFSLFITYKVVNLQSTLEWWLLPLMIVSMLLPVIIFIYRSGKRTIKG